MSDTWSSIQAHKKQLDSLRERLQRRRKQDSGHLGEARGYPGPYVAGVCGRDPCRKRPLPSERPSPSGYFFNALFIGTLFRPTVAQMLRPAASSWGSFPPWALVPYVRFPGFDACAPSPSPGWFLLSLKECRVCQVSAPSLEVASPLFLLLLWRFVPVGYSDWFVVVVYLWQDTERASTAS